MISVDLLIFDLDGTLVDTRQDLTNAVNYARQRLGFPVLQLPQVMQYVGDGVRKLLERSIPNERHHLIEQGLQLFRDFYGKHLLDCSRLYPGVAETLRHFRNKKLAVISNKPDVYTIEIIDKLCAGFDFAAILGGESLPVLKPAPDPILLILEKTNTKPGKAVMIGDSPADIQCGKAAGTLTCAVTYGFREKEILMEQKPDYIIDNLKELVVLFD